MFKITLNVQGKEVTEALWQAWANRTKFIISGIRFSATSGEQAASIDIIPLKEEPK